MTNLYTICFSNLNLNPFYLICCLSKEKKEKNEIRVLKIENQQNFGVGATHLKSY